MNDAQKLVVLYLGFSTLVRDYGRLIYNDRLVFERFRSKLLSVLDEIAPPVEGRK